MWAERPKFEDGLLTDVLQAVDGLPTGERRFLVWFRNDLRLHDNTVRAPRSRCARRRARGLKPTVAHPFAPPSHT